MPILPVSVSSLDAVLSIQTGLMCYATTWAGSSEVAQVNSKGQLQWVDYLPTAIVLATYSPTFSAVSCEDKSLNVYSPSGRRWVRCLRNVPHSILPLRIADATR